MNKKKELLKNTVIVALGQISTKFISFFLLPLYTALLSSTEYGIVDLIMTISGLFGPIVFLQMDQAIFRFLIDVRNNKEKTDEIISTSISIIIIQSIALIILFLLFGRFINNDFKYLLMIIIIISSFSSYLLQLSRGLGDNTTYSIGSLLAGGGTIIFNVIFIFGYRLGAYGMIYSTILANLFTILYIFLRKKIYSRYSLLLYSKKIRKELLRYSIPLVPNQLSWWIINVSDRTIISYFLTIAATGVYAASNKLSSIITSVFNIFNMTWAESVSLYIKDGNKDDFFSEVFNKTICLFFSVCAITISIMPFIFDYIITGSDYKSAYYQIPIQLIATFFNIIVAMLGSVYVALKKTKEIAKTSIYAAVINIVINLIFINKYKLYAASISTLVSFSSMSIYRYFDVKKYVDLKVNYKTLILIILSLIIILPSYYFRNSIICSIIFCLSIILGIIINNEMIKSIFNKIIMKVKRNG